METNHQVINKESSEDGIGKTGGHLIDLRSKHFVAGTPLVGIPSSGKNSSDSVVPILTRIRRSLRYSDTKIGSLPLRPILWRYRIPYCQVVPFAFSKSKKGQTACKFTNLTQHHICLNCQAFCTMTKINVTYRPTTTVQQLANHCVSEVMAA